MSQIIQVINEIKKELFKIGIFQSLLHSIIVFLISFIILIPFTIKWFLAFVPAGMWFIGNLFYYTKKRNLEYVESLFPLINEQLRTAKDNLGKDNEIIRRLNQDVLEKARRIKTSFFINLKALNIAVVVIIALSFSIFFTSYFNINKINFKDFNFKDPADSFKKIISGDKASGGSGEGKNEDIYGKGSVAILGNNELNLQLNPSGTELNPEDLKDPEKKNFDSAFPQDIKSSAEANFKEDIPKENQEIVKKYFEKITGGK